MLTDYIMRDRIGSVIEIYRNDSFKSCFGGIIGY